MLTWNEFAAERPDLAEAGRAMLYQFGVGLGFLATVRQDGGPRLHPMCPVLNGEGLFAFIVPSPKQRDLLRDGRYALHSFPCEDNEDAFYLTGQADRVGAGGVYDALADQFVAERAQFEVPRPSEDHVLFSFGIDTCLLTRTKGHGDPAPDHIVWHAP